MSAANRCVVTMHFDDGIQFSDWISFTMRDCYTDPLGELQFVAAPTRANRAEYRKHLKKGHLVTIKIDGVNQGTFLIMSCPRTIGRNGVVYNITCKTPLATPYEGSVDPDLEISSQTDTPVTIVVLKALSPYGFDRITGDGAAAASALTGKGIKGANAAVPIDVLKQQQCKAQEGETAYQFASRIFSRLAVCLKMAPDGQLLLSAPDYDQQPSYSLVQDPTRQTDGDYFFGDIQIQDTNEGQFSEARCRGERDENNPDVTQTARPEATVKATDLNATRPAYSADPAAAGYKPYIMRDKNARGVDRCKNVATMALGLKAKDAFSIEGEVDGFRAKTGALWQTNTTVHVYIAEEDINEIMWISERTFTQDRQGGQRTKCKLLPLGSLRLGEIPKA